MAAQTLNGILIIDKPNGFTSHDVVSKLRGILRERRIGHGGTLDPMATGVLPVFVGRSTRASSLLLDSDKIYVARFRLGLVTDTYDITGTVLRYSQEIPGTETLSLLYPSLIGKQLQRPPIYSAIKVGGKKLYEIARSGGTAEVPLREIEIYSIEDHGPVGEEFEIRVHCSKGTYIRSLVYDIGEALGCGAVLTGLRRVSTGGFSLSDAHTLEAVSELAAKGQAQSLLLGVDKLFSVYPSLTLDLQDELRCRNGAPFPSPGLIPEQLYRIYNASGSFLMLGVAEEHGDTTMVKTIKNFF